MRVFQFVVHLHCPAALIGVEINYSGMDEDIFFNPFRSNVAFILAVLKMF